MSERKCERFTRRVRRRIEGESKITRIGSGEGCRFAYTAPAPAPSKPEASR